MKLIIFTESYPFNAAAENTFMQHEVNVLLRVFPDLTIIPRNATGFEQAINKSIFIDKSLHEEYTKSKSRIFLILKTIFDIYVLEELFDNRRKFSKNKIKKIINYFANALFVNSWFKTYLRKNNLVNETIILYTYWCTTTTLGLGLSKTKFPKINIITRAHGIDVYEERGFIYFRKKTLEVIDKFYTASENAYRYMIIKYPQFKDKIKFSSLGVVAPEFITRPSVDKTFRIVSCSSNDAIKRVELIFAGLKELLKITKEIKIVWSHFGDGPLFQQLKIQINNYSNEKLKINLFGWIDNSEILRFYRENPLDLFISMSSSEGGRPVSMQEAQSCGIPILATAVGGVPEIVTKEVGILLRQNPTPTEIAEGILFFINNPDKAKTMREESIKNWQMNFNAEINFENFAKELKMLSEKI